MVNAQHFIMQANLLLRFIYYNFNREIYDEVVTIELVERLRGEEKFNSAEDLINQMNKDKENGLKIFNELNN